MGNAIVGTLVICGIGALFAIPIGVRRDRRRIQRHDVRFLDRAPPPHFTGVPSIVGVFVYALAVMPIKTFTAVARSRPWRDDDSHHRATEELLRSPVAHGGALALGAIVSVARAPFTVVLPAALPGIITGIVLALAGSPAKRPCCSRRSTIAIGPRRSPSHGVAHGPDLRMRCRRMTGTGRPGRGARARCDRAALLHPGAIRHATCRAVGRRTARPFLTESRLTFRDQAFLRFCLSISDPIGLTVPVLLPGHTNHRVIPFLADFPAFVQRLDRQSDGLTVFLLPG